MEFTIPLPGMSPKFLTSVQRYLYKDVYWSMDTIAKMWNNINRRKVKKRYIHPVGYDASKKNHWQRPISFSFVLFIYLLASGPITSWQIDGETVETVADFIFGGSKITADGDCSHEIKRRLLLGRKVMTNLDSILKSRHITLPTEVCLVKVMVFPVVMYRCESWSIKEAEHQRIDAFELWCWRRLLRVPWTARRSNQSILKEISPGCSLEGLILKLKF